MSTPALSNYDCSNEACEVPPLFANGGGNGTPSMEAGTSKADAPAEVAATELSRLVTAMRGGDESALAALYDATVGKLYGFTMTIVGSVEDAEEVVCEIYAYAWANAARYDPERGGVLGWLIMLCRSRALDRLRRRRAAAACEEEAQLGDVHGVSEAQPDHLLSMMQQHSTVRAALSRLTPEKRHLVSLAFLHDLSHQQIARLTGLPLGTIKSHLRRALAQLREAMEAA